MSLYLSVDHYKHAAQTHPNGNGERVLEVTDALDQLGRKLDAVRFTDEAFAQEQVTQLSQPQQPGKTLPLKAVPLAHKALYGRSNNDRSGWPNEGGSKPYEGPPASRTATVINKLDNAGAIDCGRLVSVEYALGVTGHNAYAGTPKNPWNPAYICGGSSSGSGAEVDAGIIPAALGSDTGGSIRLPAAACGLVGVNRPKGLSRAPVSLHCQMRSILLALCPVASGTVRNACLF